MRSLLSVLVLLSNQNAWACGYCVEYKIAATYDHAVVTRAVARHHHVAFFHVEGGATRRALEDAIYGAGAVDRGSVRVSADLLTVSFAFDPAAAPLGVLHARIDKALAARGVSLLPLRLMERKADLKTATK